jgi:hypothetical protein
LTIRVEPGGFVEVRSRSWLVEAVDDTEADLTTVRLSCIADDAQGEQIEVLLDAEISPRVLEDDTWAGLGQGAPDSPEVLAAYLRAVRWRSGAPPTAICSRRRSAPASGSMPTSCCRCARRCACRASTC